MTDENINQWTHATGQCKVKIPHTSGMLTTAIVILTFDLFDPRAVFVNK